MRQDNEQDNINEALPAESGGGPRGRGSGGITLIELIVVIIVMALMMFAIEPLVQTTWQSWIIADRRVELAGTGRPAMSKLVDEIRQAYDIYGTNTIYIDYNPQWASVPITAWGTTNIYRFDYDNPTVDLQYGATPTFASASLAAPVDTFSFTTYNRKVSPAISARQINAIDYYFTVSDARGLISAAAPNSHAQGLNPMNFRSRAWMRISREGYQFAHDMTFNSEAYTFSQGAQEKFCVMTFCDRVDPTHINLKTVTVTAPIGPPYVLTFDYFANGDYFATCCKIGPGNNKCNLGQGANVQVYIQLRDTLGEYSKIRELIQVVP